MSHKEKYHYIQTNTKEGVFLPDGEDFKAQIKLRNCRAVNKHLQTKSAEKFTIIIRIPESLACCDPAWMLYMASYICGPFSSSPSVSL